MTSSYRRATAVHTAVQHAGNTSTDRTPRSTVSDFSSAEYWSTRFLTETSFEWLLSSDTIIPFALSQAAPLLLTEASSARPLRGLHIGCGTSSLGRDVEVALKVVAGGSEVELVDADYVADSIQADATRDIPILSLDCLDLEDVRAKSPDGGWDLILDKSTADAISCGPSLTTAVHGGSAQAIEPLEMLLRNMAEVTQPGGRWISISYSATRYDIDAARLRETGWAVLDKRFLASTSLPEGRKVRDEKGNERVVWEPETGVWGWVLERT